MSVLDIPDSEPTPAPAKAPAVKTAPAGTVVEDAAALAKKEAAEAEARGASASELAEEQSIREQAPKLKEGRETIVAKVTGARALAEDYLGKGDTYGRIGKEAPDNTAEIKASRDEFEKFAGEVDALLVTAAKQETAGEWVKAQATYAALRTKVTEYLPKMDPPAFGTDPYFKEVGLKTFFPDAKVLLDEFRTEGKAEAKAILALIVSKEATLEALVNPVVATAPVEPPPPAESPPPAAPAEVAPPAAPLEPTAPVVSAEDRQAEVLAAFQGRSIGDVLDVPLSTFEAFAADVPGWDWVEGDTVTSVNLAVEQLRTAKTESNQGMVVIQQKVTAGDYPGAARDLGTLVNTAIPARFQAAKDRMSSVGFEGKDRLIKTLAEAQAEAQRVALAWVGQLELAQNAPRTPVETPPAAPTAPDAAPTTAPTATPTTAPAAAPAATTTDAPAATPPVAPVETAAQAKEKVEAEELDAVTTSLKEAYEAFKKNPPDFITAGLALLAAIMVILSSDNKLSLGMNTWKVVKPLLDDPELKEGAKEFTKVQDVFKGFGFRRASEYTPILNVPMRAVALYAKNPNDPELTADQKTTLDQFKGYGQRATEFFNTLLDKAAEGGNGGAKYATAEMKTNTATVSEFITTSLKAKAWIMPAK